MRVVAEIHYQNSCQSRFSGMYLVFEVFQDKAFKEMLAVSSPCAPAEARRWIFFDFSQGNLENLVGNLEGIFRGFFLIHRTKAHKFRGKFRSIFRTKIRSSKKIFRARFTLRTCHLNSFLSRFTSMSLGFGSLLFLPCSHKHAVAHMVFGLHPQKKAEKPKNSNFSSFSNFRPESGSSFCSRPMVSGILTKQRAQSTHPIDNGNRISITNAKAVPDVLVDEKYWGPKDVVYPWWEFRPRKKIFSPPPPKFPTNTLLAARPPPPARETPPPVGIFKKNRPPPSTPGTSDSPEQKK